MIHDLKKQGLSIFAIARKMASDRKTVRKYLDRGLVAPVYRPRQPQARVVKPYQRCLQERVQTYSGLGGANNEFLLATTAQNLRKLAKISPVLQQTRKA